MNFVFPLRRLLLSRKASLILILTNLGAIICAYLIPQKFNTTRYAMEEWYAHLHPTVLVIVKIAGLDHVYTTYWFALLLLVSLLSLLFSSWHQFQAATKLTFGPGNIRKERYLHVPRSRQECINIIKGHGYVQTFQDSSLSRLIKHPWGHWGNTLLHVGIGLSIASALVVVLSTQRGRLHLVENEVYRPSTQWVQQNNGIFVNDFFLPWSIRLDSVRVNYWETDEIKHLASDISILGDTKSPSALRQLSVSIDQILTHSGIRIYQGRKRGHAFYLVFTDQDKKIHQELIMVNSPGKRDQAGYGNFELSWLPYKLKAKYFIDRDKKTMTSDKSLLTLRLVDVWGQHGETSLQVGERAELGPYQVELVKSSLWTELIFVNSFGMSGLFLGFFVIVLGSGLAYFTPPREFAVLSSGSDSLVHWRGSRFIKLYQHEKNEIYAKLQQHEFVQ